MKEGKAVGRPLGVGILDTTFGLSREKVVGPSCMKVVGEVTGNFYAIRILLV